MRFSKILNILANIPNVFSTMRLALDNLYLKTFPSNFNNGPPYGFMRYSFNAKASFPFLGNNSPSSPSNDELVKLNTFNIGVFSSNYII